MINDDVFPSEIKFFAYSSNLGTLKKKLGIKTFIYIWVAFLSFRVHGVQG